MKPAMAGEDEKKEALTNHTVDHETRRVCETETALFRGSLSYNSITIGALLQPVSQVGLEHGRHHRFPTAIRARSSHWCSLVTTPLSAPEGGSHVVRR